MALYAFVCAAQHETLRQHPMGGEVPTSLCCEECGGVAVRVLGNYQFSKDKTRLFRNPVDGTTFSFALGQTMPDNRRDYHALLKEKGCEPVTPGTEPQVWRDNRQYLDHVQHGGERDPAFEATPATPVKTGTLTVREQMRTSNFKVPS